MNLPRMFTLMVLVCFSISCDGQASLKTPSAPTGQLKWDTVNFAIFDIPIFDSINAKKWDTTYGTFTMVFDCPNDFVFYYSNYVTKKSDTVYPDLPYKDSLNACFLDLTLDMRFKKRLACYGNLISNSLTLFDHSLNINETYRRIFDFPDCDPVIDPVSSNETPTKLLGFSYRGGTKSLHVSAVKVEGARDSRKWKILGIAPQKDHFDDAGKFIGAFSVFWVKYDEIVNTIKMFDRIHPESLISKGIVDIEQGRVVPLK